MQWTNFSETDGIKMVMIKMQRGRIMTSQMNRENKLVLLLSKQNHYMTSEELADLLDTSTKTVYRLVKKINTEFQNGHLILSEKGKGYKLDYEKFIERNKETNNLSISLSPNERQNRVMEELLLSSPRAIRISELLMPTRWVIRQFPMMRKVSHKS